MKPCKCGKIVLGQSTDSYNDKTGWHTARECLEEPNGSPVLGGPGCKADQGKPGWHLLPWLAAELVVKVLDYGAKKYAPDNWRKVTDAETRYWDAALRHLTAWARGEKLDPESGLPHLAHAACSILFLLELEKP